PMARDREARALGALADADQILLAVIESLGGDRLAVNAVRLAVSDGHTLSFERTALPAGESLPAAAEALAALLTSADATRGPGGAPVTRRGGGLQWTRRTTGFALLGAGVALAGAGLLWGLSASRADSDYRELAQTDPGSASLRTRGRRAALLADGSFLAAALSAGFGGYFTFWNPGPTAGGMSTAEGGR
ncbi:MAG TPA: PEGA domain-containing protein, partial [Myxococcaceae bacterium]|nr:PEGA domain-containing protein [Myxococcaceae bacterium]